MFCGLWKIPFRVFFFNGHPAILIHQVYYGLWDVCPPGTPGFEVFRELPNDMLLPLTVDYMAYKSMWTP